MVTSNLQLEIKSKASFLFLIQKLFMHVENLPHLAAANKLFAEFTQEFSSF